MVAQSANSVMNCGTLRKWSTVVQQILLHTQVRHSWASDPAHADRAPFLLKTSLSIPRIHQSIHGAARPPWKIEKYSWTSRGWKDLDLEMTECQFNDATVDKWLVKLFPVISPDDAANSFMVSPFLTCDSDRISTGCKHGYVIKNLPVGSFDYCSLLTCRKPRLHRILDDRSAALK